MADRIVGNDVSDNNGQLNFDVYASNSNFIVAKCSEGTGYIDKEYGFNREQARLKGLLFGSYHFARPDLGNSAQAEAEYFANLIKGDPIRQGEIVVLDYEADWAGDVVGWCKAWLDAVTELLGVKPLIYLSESLVNQYDWQPVVDAGYGLWIAKYLYNPTPDAEFNTGKWEFAAMYQWTDKQTVPGANGVLDGDVFFGTTDQFKLYGYQPAPVQPDPTPAPAETTTTTPTETVTPATPDVPTTDQSPPTETPVAPVEPTQPTTPEQPTQPTTCTCPNCPNKQATSIFSLAFWLGLLRSLLPKKKTV